MKNLFLFVFITGILSSTGLVRAEPPPPIDYGREATAPAPKVTQVRFQNYFITESYGSDGGANVFDVQPIIPVKKFKRLPRGIFRPTISVIQGADVNGSTESAPTGLGDIPYVYLFAFDKKWGTLGAGLAGALPTASNDQLGARKWTLGPSLLGMYTGIKHFQLGGLLSQTWSVGGPGDNDVSAIALQPVLIYHFGKGWYTGFGDPAWSWDWENELLYAPLSVRVGRVYSFAHGAPNPRKGNKRDKLHMETNLMYIHNVGDETPGKDERGIKFTVTFIGIGNRL